MLSALQGLALTTTAVAPLVILGHRRQVVTFLDIGVPLTLHDYHSISHDEIE